MAAYQEENGSTFSSNGKVYDLNAIFKAVQHQPVLRINVAQLVWVLKHVQLDKDDGARIAQVDLSVPILVTLDEGKELVVDGLHRLVKAQRDGVPVLPYRRVYKSDMIQARIHVATEHLQEPSYMAW